MLNNKKAPWLIAILVFGLFATTPALAHRFDVALIIPLTGTDAEFGNQYRDGFMLATTERDAHANEESDGHLGGLDVYVSLIDANGDIETQLTRTLAEKDISIIATTTTDQTLATIKIITDANNIALLTNGETPFSQADNAAVTAFSTNFKTQYTTNPTAQTAQGYNAARRINTAVRPQVSTANINALNNSFAETASGFNW